MGPCGEVVANLKFNYRHSEHKLHAVMLFMMVCHRYVRRRPMRCLPRTPSPPADPLRVEVVRGALAAESAPASERRAIRAGPVGAESTGGGAGLSEYFEVPPEGLGFGLGGGSPAALDRLGVAGGG
jgi:hypothetical protein